MATIKNRKEIDVYAAIGYKSNIHYLGSDTIDNFNKIKDLIDPLTKTWFYIHGQDNAIFGINFR